MKQNKQLIVLGALVVLLVVGLPFYVSSKKAGGINTKRRATEEQIEQLKTQVDDAKRVNKDQLRYTQLLADARVAMPDTADIDGAIRALETLAASTDVRWVSGAAPAQDETAEERAALAAEKGAATPKADEESGLADDTAGDAKSASPSTTAAAKGGVAPLVVPTGFPSSNYQISVVVRGAQPGLVNYLKAVHTAAGPARLFVLERATFDADVTQLNLTLRVVTFKPDPKKPVVTDTKSPTTTAVKN